MTRSTSTPQTVSGSTAVKVALLCTLGLLVVASVRFARFDWTGIPLERGKAVQERVVSEDCTEYIRPYTTSSGRTITPVSVDEQQYLSMVDLFSGTPRDDLQVTCLLAPFTSRPALPWLASQLPFDEAVSLALVNLAMTLIATWAIVFTLRAQGVRTRAIALVGLLIGCTSEGRDEALRSGTTTTAPGPDPTSTTTAPQSSKLEPPAWPSGEKPADVILRVHTSGGFEGLQQPPELTLYRDGRLVLLSPGTPPRQLPTFDLAQVNPAGVAKVLDAAADAGLADPKALDDPIYPDAFVTSIRVVRDGKVHESTLADGSDSDAHVRAAAFVHQLDDLRSLVGPTNMSTTRTVGPQDLAVRVYEDHEGADPAQPWPVPGFDLSVTPGGTCRRVSGADARAIVDAVQGQQGVVAWSSGGHTYRVGVDAILPDQRCDS